MAKIKKIKNEYIQSPKEIKKIFKCEISDKIYFKIQVSGTI